jgi:hypothetical protein
MSCKVWHFDWLREMFSPVTERSGLADDPQGDPAEQEGFPFFEITDKISIKFGIISQH